VASLKVICPKCFKGQQVVVEIPLGGIDHVCLFCKTTFRVKPPARPSLDDLPAAREAVPRPSDLPAAREAIPRPGDLPAPREAVPKPTDLPAAREVVPRPGNRPAPREAVPRPTDLPMDRDAIPRPGDLPMDRDAIPRPGDLPMDRDAVPRPGDLPMDRDAVPRPGDLPMDRDAVPRPGDLPLDRDAVPRPGDLPLDRDAVPRPGDLLMDRAPGLKLPGSSAERSPNKTPPLGLALELSFTQAQDPPGGSQPLSLGDPFADSLDLGLPPPPPSPPAKAAPPPPSKVPPVPPPPAQEAKPETKKPSPPHKPPPTPPRASSASTPPPPVPRSATKPLDPLSGVKSQPPAKPTLSPLVSTPSESPLQFDHVDPVQVPVQLDVRPARPAGAAKAGGENLDLGFSLELEGDARASSGTGPAAIPFPNARVASEGLAEVAAADDDEIPALAPPTSRGASAARALRPVAKKGGVPRWAFFAAGGVALALVGAFVGLPLLNSAPSPDTVIRPFLPELAKDNLVAYRNAADQLVKAAASFKEKGAGLRLKAAELILTAFAAHGGQPTDVARAEQLTEGASSQVKLAPALARTRALLAVAKGKPREAETLLTDRAAAESHLILGLARLSDDKVPSATDVIRRYVAAKPSEALGHYLLGRALAASASPDARKEFETVLAKNPAHLGALIGLARFEENPEKRLSAARALAEKKAPDAGPFELAELQLLIGQTAQTLGRTPEAIDAFQRAIASNKHLVPAYIALGESLLFEGKYAHALERLKAPGPVLELSPAGKFSMGGALIATGDDTQGLALIAAAAKERAEDPRGPFWTGFAAGMKQPPDLSAAEQGYRDAIKRDPKFLPASLKLAALLQQENKVEESLTVLRAAEEAGAPPSVLQLAWGEALIVAKEPGKAEEVFQKALESDPKSMSARLGVAASLEAQGKLAEAKASLESTLKASPETLGLRERLAQVCLKLGEKDEAMARYQEEIQAGHPTPTLRLAVARLALDLGKLELVQSETKKIFDDFPRNADAAYLMARVHEAHNEYGAAVQDYRHATTWGNTPQFALGFGRLLDKLGKQPEALASYANALSLPEARMERGRIYYRSGDLESALADFQSASKMTSSDAEPIILQGLCYDKMGNTAKAEEAWRAALRADSDAPEPHYRLGRMELDRAKPAAAIEHFRKAAAKAPAQASWRSDLYFQLAQAELLTGAKALALGDFKKFLDIAPPDAPARHEATQQVARLGGGKK
jgi:tetratricopeptide (TPR) repeat protein